MKLTLALLSLLILTGCTTLQNVHISDVKSVVRISTILYVGESPEKAANVLYVIRETRREINLIEEISIESVSQYVRENIVWQELNPIEAVTVESLIDRIERSIKNEIRTAAIPPDTMVLVNDVLYWIEDAVQLSQMSMELNKNVLVTHPKEQE